MVNLQMSKLRIEKSNTGTLRYLLQNELLKTPTVMDGHVTSGKKKAVSGDSGTLAQEIMSGYKPTIEKLGMLPTPNARDFKSPNRVDHSRGVTLPEHLQRLQDGKSFLPNPRFWAEMMGFPEKWTELPFQNGETKV